MSPYSPPEAGNTKNYGIIAENEKARRAMKAYQTEFIDFMLRAGVLTFGDFTTKSGRKTPYFVNTGNYRTGSQIAALGDYYAAAIQESGEEVDALFGPAYKGIPLAVAAASSLYRLYGRDLPYCFNRKEAKDHGEGGRLIGHKPKTGERLAIIEDVVTAGTAVRETVALFEAEAEVSFAALFVSVDRMERGTGEKSAIQELRETLGLRVYPIVTVREIMAHLRGREIGGKVVLTEELYKRTEDYLARYGV